ncbi:hypothetical protein [Lacrimispora brassicae]
MSDEKTAEEKGKYFGPYQGILKKAISIKKRFFSSKYYNKFVQNPEMLQEITFLKERY